MYCLCLPLPTAFLLVRCLAGCLLFLPLGPASQPLLSLSPKMAAQAVGRGGCKKKKEKQKYKTKKNPKNGGPEESGKLDRQSPGSPTVVSHALPHHWFAPEQ